MRKTIAITLLATALALAGDKTPEELVSDLGATEYQVREDATRALIALGDKAVPALEKALQSEDVEVRMRAGRALRAIRGDRSAPKQGAEEKDAEEKGAEEFAAGEKKAPDRIVRERSVSIQMKDGEQVVTIRETDADGKRTTRTFTGKSLEEIKEKHPEVAEVLGNVRIGGLRDPFGDFEKWKSDGWGGLRDDDFWKQADEDLNREISRLREWARSLARQKHRQRHELDERAQNDATLLGVRVRRPEAVLDAQLELRGRGLVIEEVLRGSLAHRLGLERFDILLEVNGMAVRGLADVGPALRGRDDGKPVTAKVLRRGRTVDVETPDDPTPRAESERREAGKGERGGG